MDAARRVRVTATLVAVDLGGTNIRSAVVTGDTSHGAVVHRDTPVALGPDGVLDAVAASAREAASGAAIDGLAIGIPGPLDPRTGVVHGAPNLPGWREVPARDALAARLQCPVAVHNDASLAAYAEWKAGAGGGTRHFVFITASTGVGGALILDGALYDGAGRAGEIGHSPVGSDAPACAAGHPGCLEGTASGTAIARAARAAVHSGAASSLAGLDVESIGTRQLEDQCRKANAAKRLQHLLGITPDLGIESRPARVADAHRRPHQPRRAGMHRGGRRSHQCGRSAVHAAPQRHRGDRVPRAAGPVSRCSCRARHGRGPGRRRGMGGAQLRRPCEAALRALRSSCGVTLGSAGL